MNPLRTLLAAALAVSGGIAYTGDFSKASFSGQSDAGSQIVSQVAQEDNSEATESPAYSGWGHADAYGEVLAQLKGQQLQDSQKLSSIDAKLSTVMSRMQTMSQEIKAIESCNCSATAGTWSPPKTITTNGGGSGTISYQTPATQTVSYSSGSSGTVQYCDGNQCYQVPAASVPMRGGLLGRLRGFRN